MNRVVAATDSAVVCNLPKSTMAWFNSEACGRQRKYMKGSCLMGETFGCNVSNVSIGHDTPVVTCYSSSDDMFRTFEITVFMLCTKCRSCHRCRCVDIVVYGCSAIGTVHIQFNTLFIPGCLLACLFIVERKTLIF